MQEQFYNYFKKYFESCSKKWTKLCLQGPEKQFKTQLKKKKKEQLNNGLKNYLKNLLEIIQGTLSQQGKIKLAVT